MTPAAAAADPPLISEQPAAPAAIVATEVTETSALTRWEALAADIAIETEEAAAKNFNYHDKWDNKAARSYVTKLRRLKGRIERARKDAKSVHLERGRAVDATAKTLEEAVEGLISPHQLALDAIEAAEQARIDAHRAVLDRITALADAPVNSADAEARLAELATIDIATLEEFSAAAENRLAEATAHLQAQRDILRQQEAEQAELEALRAEKAAREEADRLEAVRLEVIAQEQARQERERAAEVERQERERAAEAQLQERERQAAAQREADALAAAAAARQAQEAAEQRAAELERQAQEAADKEQARLEAEQRAAAERQERMAALQDALRQQLTAVLGMMGTHEIADAIVEGSLHPALSIDWSAV